MDQLIDRLPAHQFVRLSILTSCVFAVRDRQIGTGSTTHNTLLAVNRVEERSAEVKLHFPTSVLLICKFLS